jgi:hypothetical protein
MTPDATISSFTYGLREQKISRTPHRNGLFYTIEQRLEQIEITNPKLARWLCRVIPANCPFARTIKLFGYTLLCIPPLCKLNPFYDQLMALRFRSLSFLADTCGEDIAKYCC